MLSSTRPSTASVGRQVERVHFTFVQITCTRKLELFAAFATIISYPQMFGVDVSFAHCAVGEADLAVFTHILVVVGVLTGAVMD